MGFIFTSACKKDSEQTLASIAKNSICEEGFSRGGENKNKYDNGKSLALTFFFILYLARGGPVEILYHFCQGVLVKTGAKNFKNV